MESVNILSILVFTPIVGAALLAFFKPKNTAQVRHAALAISSLTFLLSLGMLWMYSTAMGQHEDGDLAARGSMQLVEFGEWLPSLGVHFHLGVDGISILLVLLTTLLSPLILLSSWKAIGDRVKEFQIAFLLLEGGMIGVFLALDLVVFYVFWEVMLVPMYLLVGIWGGERRIYAAMKFFIYTMVGSLLMLLAMLYLWWHTGTVQLIEHGIVNPETGLLEMMPGLLEVLRTNPLEPTTQVWLFAAFALSFAIKVPIFPLHTWLPDAHVEAPTAGSVVLAGVLLKMGTYGFIRLAIPLFPHGTEVFTPWMLGLSVVGIVFGACMALVQTDVKKLIAYSSVSHMGFVVIGLFVINDLGWVGGIIQMVSHGLSTGMLFLLIGIVYERRHTREISHFGGLAQVIPVFSVMFIIATLSSIGLPGLNGFVGEFMILLGAFREHQWIAIGASSGVVLGAVYMLTLAKRFLFGPLVHEENRNLADLSPRELCYLVPIVVMMFWIGLYPKPFVELIEPSVQLYVDTINK